MAIVIAGCHAKEHPITKPIVTAPTPAPKSTHDPVKELVAEADRELAESMKLDYRRPLFAEPIDSDRIRLKYWRACREGNHRACWMVGNIMPTSGREDAYDEEADAMVRKNCLASDILSCRAIRTSDRSLGDLEHRAIYETCNSEYKPCDIDGLRRECQAGFPINCKELLWRKPATVDLPEIAAITHKLVSEGCRQGILSECESLKNLEPPSVGGNKNPDQIWALEQVCQISGMDCYDLGTAYSGFDPEKSRDAYELACQLSYRFGDLMFCQELWRMYLRPRLALPEPFPGRAKQLRDWACEKHQDCWK